MRFMTSLKFIDVVAREGSIRKAADKLAITSTALNRRILQIEDEIGQPLFERLPGGVRLNTAGEIFVQHIRSQFADLARVQSQIADLSGIRRGHVQIASGADANSIREQAIKDGMRTLRQDALAKLSAGITTPEEVVRVTRAV